MNSISTKSEEELHKENILKEDIQNEIKSNKSSENNDESFIFFKSLNIILDIYAYDEESDDILNELNKKLSIIKNLSFDLKCLLYPSLLGIYIIYNDKYLKISKIIINFLLSETKYSLQLGHILILNIFSCKNSYKKYLNLKGLSNLINQIYENYHFEEENLTENNNNNKKIGKEIYTSLFSVYNSMDDFIAKNLVKLEDPKANINHLFKIKWNQFYLNKRKNNVIKNNEKNIKWLKYISNIIFINDLVNISDLLRSVKIDDRKKALKEFILYLNKDYFPSNLYNPMHYSNIKENLLKIDEKYSYPINTKERCPCHILFEFSNEENKNSSNKNLKLDNNSIKSKNTISSGEKSLFNLSEINTLPKKYLNDETSSSIYIPKVNSQFSLFVPNKNEKNTNNGGWLSCFNPNYKNNDEKEFEFEVNSTQNQNITISNSSVFGKYKFNQIQSLILDNSKYKNNLNHKNRYIYSSIIKGGDELRHDYFISLSLYLFNDIFKKKNIFEINLFPFQVISNGSGGFIQTIINSTSLSKINQINFEGIDFSYLERTSSFDDKYISNLKKYFTINFSQGIEYETAIKNFISSLVGYSLICYFFDVKDRNNGNILIDDKGNMFHIDFGFLLNKSPGNIKFEKAPFKLSKDFIDLLGGIQSKYFFTFQELFYKGFKAIRENYDTIILFVELYCDLFNDLFSFHDKNEILKNLKEKFLLYTKSNEELYIKCNEIILNSIDNWRTKAYDEFQRYCVGIN